MRVVEKICGTLTGAPEPHPCPTTAFRTDITSESRAIP